jgi:hypothetical protein
VTYWLPIIPGFIAFRVLRRNGHIGRLEDVEAHMGSTRSLQGMAINMRRVPHTRRSDMERIKKNKLAAAVAGVLALFGLGAGVATASNGSAHPSTVQVQPAAVTSVIPPVDTPAGSAGQPAPAADKAEPAGADHDNIQEGDQNGADDANEANEANDPAEKEGTEAPDGGKEDAPGQADSQGQNVSSQGVM